MQCLALSEFVVVTEAGATSNKFYQTGSTRACLERAALKGDYDTQERKPILTASVQNYSTT